MHGLIKRRHRKPGTVARCLLNMPTAIRSKGWFSTAAFNRLQRAQHRTDSMGTTCSSCKQRCGCTPENRAAAGKHHRVTKMINTTEKQLRKARAALSEYIAQKVAASAQDTPRKHKSDIKLSEAKLQAAVARLEGELAEMNQLEKKC